MSRSTTSNALSPYRYTVLGQGITSASDIFNLLTDGDLRINGLNAIRNMETAETKSVRSKQEIETCD